MTVTQSRVSPDNPTQSPHLPARPQMHALIIGAGLGGLATAIRLGRRGFQVTVLEKTARPGGRANQIQDQGYSFDTGPTLLLMPDVLEELFRDAGRDIHDYLDLRRMAPNYRIQFGDGSTVEFSGDPAAMKAELDRIEPGAGRRYETFLREARYNYQVARERFVERNFTGLFQFVTPTNLYYLLRTRALRKLYDRASRVFQDDRLRIAFTFQTMYLGISPYDSPAIYSLLAGTEIVDGIWYPMGGMYEIPKAMARLAAELGATIECHAEVAEVLTERGRATGVRLTDGRSVRADLVIANADLPYVYEQLVPRPYQGAYAHGKANRLQYGCSAYLLYLGTDRRYENLRHHNVYLARDTARNFAQIFQDRALPDAPSLYVNRPTVTDPSVAPPGGDNLYVLVPVPHLTPAIDWQRDEPAFRQLVYDKLEQVGIADLRQHVRVEHVFTPADFHARYYLERGAAFGLSHHFWQVGYLRPNNKASRLPNLYFVGASTVPGGGVPMVILSSRLVTERIRQDVPQPAT